MKATRPVLLLLGLAAALGCRRDEPPVLRTLPDFALTERSGRTVGSSDLRGHVWVVNFIFTRCPDVCPALTAQMATLQRTLPEDATDPVRIVSLSVDPAHDTPPVLQAYAARAGAGPSWLFLTGSRDAVAGLLRDGFQVAFADDGPPEAPITHSDRVALVDRELRIRGYYRPRDDGELDRLTRDVRALHATRS